MENAFFTHTKRWFCSTAIILLFNISAAQAEINISINPVEGGSSLRFGKVNWSMTNDKQVNVRITSNDGKQYQVYQRIANPLVNERGYSLTRSALMTGGLTSSNAYGSLYLQGLEPLGYIEQLLYSSDQAGHGDSFTVFYRANLDQITEAGTYFGNISYTAREIGGSGYDQVLLKVELESAPETRYETTASHGKDRIRLKNSGTLEQTGYFTIKYHDSSGDKISITQEFLEPLHNDKNELLNPETVSFSTSGDCPDQSYPSFVILEKGKKNLCQDNNSEGDLTVHFKYDAATESNPAGIYYGRLRYAVESSGQSKNYDVDLQVEITPIFKMDLEYPNGGVAFNRLVPNEPPQTKDVIVTVQTNLGKSYSVSQTMSGPMANEKGKNFDAKYFVYKVELLDGSKGKPAKNDFQPVELKNAAIFYSDQEGAPAKFRVIYRLSPFEGMDPGKYGAAITYSLGEN